MATQMMTSSKLQISYETGVDEKGNPIFKTKTYSNVKEEATADQLLQVAQGLASLSNYPFSGAKRNDSSDIV